MTLGAKRMLAVATLVIALFVPLFSILDHAIAASLQGSRVAAYIYLANDDHEPPSESGICGEGKRLVDRRVEWAKHIVARENDSVTLLGREDSNLQLPD